MYQKIICYIILIPFLLVNTSCATIVSGRMQQVPVISSPSGAIATMGTIKQETPATFTLDRRMGVYQITVEKEGYEPVTITLKKGMNGWVWGNIIFGGIIGLIVDIASGSASKFEPSEVEVNLIAQKLGMNSADDLKKYAGKKDLLFIKLARQQ